MCDTLEDVIKIGTYVIIKRHNYKKLYKVTENGRVNLGKIQVDMKEIIGKKYWTTFEMVPAKNGNRHFFLKETTEIESWDDLLSELPSGHDNRGIMDDGTSQKLSKEEILQLQESGKSGKEIVGSLIENSKSFLDKTGYSQEKYVKKKEKKYSRYLTICKPTISILYDIYFKLDQNKISGLRMDSLAQMLTYSDVQSEGLFLLYDSGSQGLPASAMLNRIGATTKGCLINLHPGNVPQTTLIQAMNYPSEQLERLINVSIYSFLRMYYQGEDSIVERILSANKTQQRKKPKEEINKEDLANRAEEPMPDPVQNNKRSGMEEGGDETEDTTNPLKRKLEDAVQEVAPPKRPRWLLETQRAVGLIKNTKARGLVIIAKEHPLNIVNALLEFLEPSRPFVIFHVHREPLQQTYMALKQQKNVINLRLLTNFLRSYQVLPDRTHPDIFASDTGGYLLTGYLVE